MHARVLMHFWMPPAHRSMLSLCCPVVPRSVPCSAGQGLLSLAGPDSSWRNEADCGVDEFSVPGQYGGGTIPLNCAGPAHAHFRDMDGSLLGLGAAGDGSAGRGIIIGRFDAPRGMPYGQSTPVIPGPCTFSSAFKAYVCVPGSNDYTEDAPRGLTPGLKPSPTPKYGIFGDPQYFVLESRDGDSEDRNFSPVTFNSSGVIDMAVPQMDVGWCFSYTCQKRLSIFFTYLPTWQITHIKFGGIPARAFRLWLPYAQAGDELIVTLNYKGLPDRCARRRGAGGLESTGRAQHGNQAVPLNTVQQHVFTTAAALQFVAACLYDMFQTATCIWLA